MNLKQITSALVISAACFGISTSSAKDFTKEEIESIVHDYIINNPDVLIEAQDKIEQRKAELEKVQQNKILNEIYSDKAIPKSGPDNAKHKVIEFFDYNCGYCKRSRPLLLETLKDRNDVQYIYLEFPILSDISVTAAKVGLALYAYDKAKYKQYNDNLMTSPERLTSEIRLQALVEELGLNWQEIKTLSESKQVSETILKIRNFAKEFNVSGTPAFIIDGEILHGAPTSKGLIESYLK
ncbi:MAG: DsbA family protein [Succinivibrionaceae bacterium]|nr:DsbA family protein [Ruminobacter sp.]MDY5779004.1 DsbA family protein [Succinivibrionaceae bacterium]MEE1339415.1 DsbA family protein [Succinivibrionaceae bacterium]